MKVKSNSWIEGWAVWQVIWNKPSAENSEPTWEPTWCQFLLAEPPAQKTAIICLSSLYKLHLNFISLHIRSMWGNICDAQAHSCTHSSNSKFLSKFSRKPLSGISDQKAPLPPFRKTSDLRWPKFTPKYPPKSCNPGDRMWRLICNPRGYHSFIHWRSDRSRILLEGHWPCRRPQPKSFQFFSDEPLEIEKKWWAIGLEDWWSEVQFPPKKLVTCLNRGYFLSWTTECCLKERILLVSLQFVLVPIVKCLWKWTRRIREMFVYSRVLQTTVGLSSWKISLWKWIIKHRTFERGTYNCLVLIFCRIIH